MISLDLPSLLTLIGLMVAGLTVTGIITLLIEKYG